MIVNLEQPINVESTDICFCRVLVLFNGQLASSVNKNL